MHLLATQSGVIDGGAEAVDLRQPPGDVVVLTAADTELAGLAHAFDRLPGPKPSLRLANLMALGHNLSVDTYLDDTASRAKLIVVRLLGGRAYWTYGIDQLVDLARERGIRLALLPGGGDPDPELQRLSTLGVPDCERLRRYLAFGGAENAQNFLRHAFALLGSGEEAPEPRPFPATGLYGEPGAEPYETPVAAIVFYRALLEGGFTAPVDALSTALRARGLNPLPLYVSSLKEPESARLVADTLAEATPSVILNATGFAVGSFSGESGDNPFAASDCPVLQVVFSGTGEEEWRESAQGLSARDLAMNVVLPELDGRLMTRAVSFKADDEYHAATHCRIVSYRPVPDRIAFVADLAANWARLRATAPETRRIAVVLANYPNRDGRIGNGVGYDTPASTVAILNALSEAGYAVEHIPADGNALLEKLLAGPTNSSARAAASEATLDLNRYASAFAQLPEKIRKEVTERWGTPERDPFVRDGAFHLPVRLHGNVAVAIQPARGYNIDPKDTYHDPALVPPHGYLAFYLWLRESFGVHAVIHNGKHGNLEWLPGKATGLSAECYPEAALGPLPQLYPFIVNDPGEGTQAKRRTAAVIIDHLTPPLARAESYGPLKELEALLDEYYLASGLDRRRLEALKAQILDLVQSGSLDEDAGIRDEPDQDEALRRLDAYLCDLKEAQIRDGLHVLGSSPQGEQEAALLVALARSPRGDGEGGNASLIRALAGDFGFDGFDPFDCDLAAPWTGPRPERLEAVSGDPWRTNADTLERLELHALALVRTPHPRTEGVRSDPVRRTIEEEIRPALRACGTREIEAMLKGLDGRFVAPGPSGAPTRGRLDVLPTGRNFYSVDNRALPTPTAWDLGRRSAEALLKRHFQEHGRYPTALGLSAWGTSNMRTGGDDIAQALALIGAKPRWDPASWRVTGFDILTLAELGRPRIDVTLRISGFFRDAFPAQIELFDRAVRAVGALDEEAADNPIAARMRAEAAELRSGGMPEDEARRLAGFRVFGSKPGAYGAGLQALIDEKLWAERADLAAAYLAWGSFAYGANATGEARGDAFRTRLSRLEAVVHNQDNREHDLLDSDDYYQFEGGMTAAVEHLSGARPKVYHNDHSRPERPVIRTLEEEIGRVVRSRVVNPKWIAGVMRHGYKGAFEIAATVDYLFAFAATTGAVKSHHFDLAYDAYLLDEEVRDFIAANNPAALAEIAQRFEEAAERGLWSPKSNSAHHRVRQLARSRAEVPA